MEQNIRLSLSPSNPGIGVVDKMVMKIHAPYSSDSVTIQFNPNIQDYKKNADQPNVQIRQLTVTIPTEQTAVLLFDFKANNIHDVTIDDTKYNVKLMNIGKDQEFPYFDFFVTAP